MFSKKIAFGQIPSMEDFGQKDEYFAKLRDYDGNYLITYAKIGINDVNYNVSITGVVGSAICVPS